MDIQVTQGDITQFEADVAIVNLFEGINRPAGATGAMDETLDGAISSLIESGEITGKLGEITSVHPLGKVPARRVIVVGLGKPEDFNVDRIRDLSGQVIRAVRKPGTTHVATILHGAGIAAQPVGAAAQALVEGALLGAYRFTRHKGTGSPDAEKGAIETLSIVEHDAGKLAEIERSVERGIVIAKAVNFARDMANEPSNHLTPTMLAERATAMADGTAIEATVLDEDQMREKGMGSFLSVAKGSDEPAKMVVLSYTGRGGEGYDLGLVGKGITFDTGGISIKPAAGMEAMKADMTGAATVIAAMQAIAALQPKVNVLAIACCTENMPGGHATKPGDVVTAMNGRTIEVINTDAEGRLVLADGLCYARELGATRLIDVATLTGAMSVALGDQAYGLFANNEEWLSQVQGAITATGERAWPLPMWKEYGDQIKSEVADIKNTGGRDAGSITAAKFLEHFVEDVPWVHMDIASVDNLSKDRGWIVKGVSGLSVRPLIQLAEELAEG